MKFKVRGHKLLVKPIEVSEEDVTKGGIVIPKDSKTLKMEKKGSEKGTVLQIGSTCWKGESFNDTDPNWEPWCGVDDLIFFRRYSGIEVIDEDTNTTYLIINDQDVQCVIDKE